MILNGQNSGRWADKRTGQMDHLVYNSPPRDALREHHDDDTPDAVHQRLGAHESMTAVSLPFLGHKSLLSSAGVGAPFENSNRISTERVEAE